MAFPGKLPTPWFLKAGRDKEGEGLGFPADMFWWVTFYLL